MGTTLPYEQNGNPQGSEEFTNDLLPYVHAIDCFGPERNVRNNFPVDKCISENAMESFKKMANRLGMSDMKKQHLYDRRQSMHML